MTVTPWLGPIFTCGAHYSAEEYLTLLLACLVTVPNFGIGLMLGYLTTKPQKREGADRLEAIFRRFTLSLFLINRDRSRRLCSSSNL